jgi:hypothetical protein
MTLSLTLIATAILAVFSLFLIARSHSRTGKDLSNLSENVKPVDLEAFQNLMSLREEKFLSENLSARMFRHIQRQRLLAAIAYITSVAGNSVVLMRIGEMAQSSQDLEIVSAGRELAEAASHLRIYSILVLAKLYVGVLMPGTQLSPTAIAEQYQDLCQRMSRLSRLRVSSGAPRITAAL